MGLQGQPWRFLLSRGLARERSLVMLRSFAAVREVRGFRGNPMADELAFVFMEFASEEALPYVRQALRSQVPAAVSNMGAVLGLLDRDWCHRELTLALQEPGVNTSNRRYLAAALGLSQHLETREKASQLMPAPPEHDHGKMGYTYDEVLSSSLGNLFGGTVNHVRPLAERLREAKEPNSTA